MAKILYLDTETTGTDSGNPSMGIASLHGVHQVAGIIEDYPARADQVLTEEFNLFANPFTNNKLIAEWVDYKTKEEHNALQVSGVTVEQVLSYPDYRKTYNDMISIFAKHVNKFDKEDKFILVGYNVQFDKDMLYGWAFDMGDKFLGSFIDHRVVDLLSLARAIDVVGKFNPRPEDFKLSTLCEYFDIPINAHDALEDIRATRALMFKLIELLSTNNDIEEILN